MPALVVYMLFGLALAWRLLPSHRGAVKCWLGLVFGCAALMWLPCLIAFFAGFTMTAQLVALCLATVGTVCLLLIGKDYKLPRPAEGGGGENDIHRNVPGGRRILCQLRSSGRCV